jgi:hypothetical protein
MSTHRDSAGAGSPAFDVLSRALAAFDTASVHLPPGGVVYRGRPAFLTGRLLERLQREARETRATATRFGGHSLATGTPLAAALARSDEVAAFVSAQAGPIRKTGTASYLFYDRPGDGIGPHVDTDLFTVSILTVLEHRHGRGGSSHLVLYHAADHAERIALAPGETLVIFTGGVVHGREPTAEGESITVLTLGFYPSRSPEPVRDGPHGVEVG